MRFDWYTKAVLTVIALLLGVIAWNGVLHPQSVNAQALPNVQFSAASGGFWLYDTKSGDAWAYEASTGMCATHAKVSKLGGPAEIAHY